VTMERVVFGLHVPPEGRDFKEIKNICIGAENLGFDLFTITDHFMNMSQPDGPSRHPLECWSTLAGLAAVTSKIRLGPLVSCYYYRHPTVLAKMATTIDIISRGRLVFGIGAGWHQKEFEGFFGQFPRVSERMKGLEETIQICRSMFENERTSFTGKLYHVDNVLNSPLPVQRPMPILVGGGGELRTLRIAAKYADISHFAFNPTEEVVNMKLAALKKHCGIVKREFSEVRKGISITPIVGFTKEEIKNRIRQRAESLGMTLDEYQKRVGSIGGTPEHYVEIIRGFIDKGVTLFTTGFLDLKNAQLFAKEVIAKLR
jgi:alkanesulfonate monooxygenase SsuD/methylene tetrahydromethanopterin reductase-like flavin-dependent oxidoreductase (luciferase family)